MNPNALSIAMVAGEPSGDLLASRIIQGILQHYPHTDFSGIGGGNMLDTGFTSHAPMDALTVFGYVDALKRLPQLIGIYNRLKKQLLTNRPDVFVGVDAPDFNLRLEKQLKEQGIPTVHFVGPSIWAWRYERIHKIRESVSHMLVLFPFEEEIYQKENIPVTYVGHPLAAQIPLDPDKKTAREFLGLPLDAQILAILPGSRSSEIQSLGKVFLETAVLLQKKNPHLHFIIPLVNEARKQEMQQILAQFSLNNIHCYTAAASGRPIAWDCMQACDAALVASGTACLETALFKRPMVISYILPPVMKAIMRWKAGQNSPLIPWVGLPNILLREFAVPELLQDQAKPDLLADACENALYNEAYVHGLQEKFQAMHLSLTRDTALLAQEAILATIKKGA